MPSLGPYVGKCQVVSSAYRYLNRRVFKTENAHRGQSLQMNVWRRIFRLCTLARSVKQAFTGAMLTKLAYNSRYS